MSPLNVSLWSDEAKRAYAAGILDGEGCIGITRNKRKHPMAVVQVGQGVKGWAILEFLRENFGFGVTNQSEFRENRCFKKAAFAYREKAFSFLEKVYPYLLFKNKQAEVMFVFRDIYYSLRPRHDGLRHWTPGAKEAVHRLAKQIHWLNRKGPASNSDAPPPMPKERDLFSDLD